MKTVVIITHPRTADWKDDLAALLLEEHGIETTEEQKAVPIILLYPVYSGVENAKRAGYPYIIAVTRSESRAVHEQLRLRGANKVLRSGVGLGVLASQIAEIVLGL